CKDHPPLEGRGRDSGRNRKIESPCAKACGLLVFRGGVELPKRSHSPLPEIRFANFDPPSRGGLIILRRSRFRLALRAFHRLAGQHNIGARASALLAFEPCTTAVQLGQAAYES